MFTNSHVRARHLVSATPRGFSLIEVVIFIVIVSVALVGVLTVMDLTTRHSADPLIRKQAIALAESMLEEVSLQAFDNPPPADDFAGPFTQPNRVFFDSIGDYNSFTTSGAYAIGGAAAISGLAGYNVSVSVVPTDLGPAASQITSASGNARLITVTVTGPDNVPVSIAGYRTNFY